MVQNGDAFAATAWVSQEFQGYSRYRDGAICWQTMVHELGHNLGLMHAGALTTSGTFQEYQDDALMGYQRSWRAIDFNAAARYQLGFIESSEVAMYPADTTAIIRALNEGHRSDTNKLLMRAQCSDCVSLKTAASSTSGYIYISFRATDSANTYGVSNSVGSTIRANDGTTNTVTFEDRVHVHYQKHGSYSEFWKSMNEGETWTVTGSSLIIKVCKITTSSSTAPVSTETATVVMGTSSDDLQCDWPPSPPPSPPAAPPPPCLDCTFTLSTQNYGSEVSWDVDGQISSTGGYTSYSTYTQTACMSPGAHVLNMLDSYGDGWNSGSIALNCGSTSVFTAATLASGSAGTFDFTI
eukprot:2887362-Prymnesium_polylepis.1